MPPSRFCVAKIARKTLSKSLFLYRPQQLRSKKKLKLSPFSISLSVNPSIFKRRHVPCSFHTSKQKKKKKNSPSLCKKNQISALCCWFMRLACSLFSFTHNRKRRKLSSFPCLSVVAKTTNSLCLSVWSAAQKQKKNSFPLFLFLAVPILCIWSLLKYLKYHLW